MTEGRKNQEIMLWVIGIIGIAALLIIYFTPIFGVGITGGAISSGEEIKIGFIAPLTGPFADWGDSIKNGLDLALEDT